MQNTFETKRLRLALLQAGDAGFMLTLMNTLGWLEFIGDRNIRTLDDAAAYIQKISDNPLFFYWAVRLKDDPAPIGVVTFLQRDYLEHPDIGFAFLPKAGKKGYAYEASKAVLDAAMSDPAHTNVLATTLPNNTGSIRLLEKLGLRLDQTMRMEQEELLVYAMASDR